MGSLKILACLDSHELADARRAELNISRDMATYHSREVIRAVESGSYETTSGRVDWKRAVVDAMLAKVSIPPWQVLPPSHQEGFELTKIQVSNETTIGAILRLNEQGLRPLSLNFANGVEPGGGFLRGARAQEEAICRVSSLYWTLQGDAMYLHHSYRHAVDSTDWAILSPQVPVFRSETGSLFDTPLLADFITCAAPYTPTVGQPTAGDLLRNRIHRVFAIAKAYGYSSLILGAWGCGAFGNDPNRTARDFREAIEGDFNGQFASIVFAIADWSDDRKFLSPFVDVFSDS